MNIKPFWKWVGGIVLAFVIVWCSGYVVMWFYFNESTISRLESAVQSMEDSIDNKQTTPDVWGWERVDTRTKIEMLHAFRKQAAEDFVFLNGARKKRVLAQIDQVEAKLVTTPTGLSGR